MTGAGEQEEETGITAWTGGQETQQSQERWHIYLLHLQAWTSEAASFTGSVIPVLLVQSLFRIQLAGQAAFLEITRYILKNAHLPNPPGPKRSSTKTGTATFHPYNRELKPKPLTGKRLFYEPMGKPPSNRPELPMSEGLRTVTFINLSTFLPTPGSEETITEFPDGVPSNWLTNAINIGFTASGSTIYKGSCIPSADERMWLYFIITGPECPDSCFAWAAKGARYKWDKARNTATKTKGKDGKYENFHSWYAGVSKNGLAGPYILYPDANVFQVAKKRVWETILGELKRSRISIPNLRTTDQEAKIEHGSYQVRVPVPPPGSSIS
ncbi:hypothetical protein BDP27DRAFT_1416469 [Rhodocollybia butyracea]|uniref:Uncharacterized protein n=1 Tax=Rhodocollybia butyracea TaxID=206335 RepID=A0A9P5PX74_9AGAR|nr:hypothetical protein BDP27DRAFT_1416469 [Rhodocollybia butyracea]